MKHTDAAPFGARLLEAGGVRFSFWAPDVDRVVLLTGEGDDPVSYQMARDADGWHMLTLQESGAGSRYQFLLPDGMRVPDPASRFNPLGVHGPSEVVDPRAYVWRNDGWRGRPWHEAVIYELHVGAFSVEGTFAAAERRLADLAHLGITAIELMPVAAFAGRRNWGYDGVLPFAPDASYGAPDELKSFIDLAHGLGMMVLLDVVYNHFGPEGNYLNAYCGQFFNKQQRTPWGAAINFDAAGSRVVRDFFIQNALYWVDEYRFDGLRLDAVHAIHDQSALHVVDEICAALRAGPGSRRQIHVVLENDANLAAFLQRDLRGTPVTATAQWNDDFHHAAHVLLTGETGSYYTDFADTPLTSLGDALAHGFIRHRQQSGMRRGKSPAATVDNLPLAAFVSFLQSHDQVGNRACGERIGALADPAMLRAASVCLLLSPHTPMFFMGEEYLASTPFLYFCDFKGELAEAVRAGRLAAFAAIACARGADAAYTPPDPNAAEAFAASKLDWAERQRPSHARQLKLVRELLVLRHERLLPLLSDQPGDARFAVDGMLLEVDWELAAGHRWRMLANFGNDAVDCGKDGAGITSIYEFGSSNSEAGNRWLEPGGVCVSLLPPCGDAGSRHQCPE